MLIWRVLSLYECIRVSFWHTGVYYLSSSVQTYSMCCSTSMCACSMCGHTFCVPHLDFGVNMVSLQRTLGHKAQLGIIKACTDSMKGSQAAIEYPRQSSLEWGLTTTQFLNWSEEKAQISQWTRQWKCVSIKAKNTPGHVISLKKQHFMIILIYSCPLSSADWSDRQYQIIGWNTDNTEVNNNRPGWLY